MRSNRFQEDFCWDCVKPSLAWSSSVWLLDASIIWLGVWLPLARISDTLIVPSGRKVFYEDCWLLPFEVLLDGSLLATSFSLNGDFGYAGIFSDECLFTVLRVISAYYCSICYSMRGIYQSVFTRSRFFSADFVWAANLESMSSWPHSYCYRFFYCC